MKRSRPATSRPGNGIGGTGPLPDRLRGSLARARIAAAGIPSFLFDSEMSWEAFGGIILIRLMVDEDDWADARAILEEPAMDQGAGD